MAREASCAESEIARASARIRGVADSYSFSTMSSSLGCSAGARFNGFRFRGSSRVASAISRSSRDPCKTWSTSVTKSGFAIGVAYHGRSRRARSAQQTRPLPRAPASFRHDKSRPSVPSSEPQQDRPHGRRVGGSSTSSWYVSDRTIASAGSAPSSSLIVATRSSASSDAAPPETSTRRYDRTSSWTNGQGEDGPAVFGRLLRDGWKVFGGINASIRANLDAMAASRPSFVVIRE